MDYPGSELDTSYSYEREVGSPPVTQVGHLFSVSRGGRTVLYDYDAYWRRIRDGELQFSLDSNGNVREVTYPQGVTVRTTYDYADRPVKLELREGSGSYSFVIGALSGSNSAASYRAYGPLASLPMGNGRWSSDV